MASPDWAKTARNLALLKEFKIVGSCHPSGSHVGLDDINAHGGIFRNYDGPRSIGARNRDVTAFFPLGAKTGFLKNAFEPLPTDGS